MSTQPTDAELFALIKEHFGLDQRRDDTVINRSTGRFHDAQRYRDFAAAVLAIAKWGQPAQAQAVPMTSRQINDARCADLDPDDRPEPWAFTQGVRAAEKHHSIKGGQHGTE